MKIFLSILLFNFLSLFVCSQTVTVKPIYKGNQRLNIKEFENTGAISFLYQDQDYTQIVKIESFYVDNKKKAIELIDKAIFILKMNKTDTDQNIEDKFGPLSLKRYGFLQEVIHISNKQFKPLSLTLEELENIKKAIQEYQFYQNDINKK